jgi:hypothetical protein
MSETNAAAVNLPKWIPTQVATACADGMVAEPSIVHEWCPGLAVTMHDFGIFRVTHIASGMALGGRYERVGSACRELAEWAAVGRAIGMAFALADAVVVRDTLMAHLDDAVPFPGATTTEKGVTRPSTVREWYQLIRTSDLVDEFPWESESPMDRCDELLKTLAP